MNSKIFALAATFALTLPALTLSIAPTASIAAAPAKLEGYFMDDKVSVEVLSQNGYLTYKGTDLTTGKSISLKRVKIAGSNSRKIYTWSNAGTNYQVIWQPKDPDFVRLQVINPNGSMLTNRLLSREHGC
jgi:hypothetical protein